MIRQFVNDGEVVIDRIDTQDNIAHPFTKNLSHSVLVRPIKDMGMKLHNWPQVQMEDLIEFRVFPRGDYETSLCYDQICIISK